MPELVIAVVAALMAAYCIWKLRSEKSKLSSAENEIGLLRQERSIVINFMHNMVEALGEGVQSEELYENITHAAIQSTGALSAAVFKNIEDREMRCAAIEGLFPPHRPLPEEVMGNIRTRAKFVEKILRSETFPIGEGVVGGVAQTRKGVLVKDALSDGRIFQHSDEALKVYSVVAVPILFREELLGVLCVANPANREPFTEVDFSLIENLAEQAGLALHNARNVHSLLEKNKLDVDLALAANIQHLLLPRKFPDVPGLDIAVTYLLAQKVGGDLYNVFKLSEHRIGIAIADVSGKGIPGSLMMAITQTHLRHYALTLDSPRDVLLSINQELMDAGIRKEMFITFVYAIIDTKKAELSLARAGHELPVLARSQKDGTVEVERLDSSGMALGMVDNRIFSRTLKDISVPFHPGDAFFLYTDGITEAANKDGKEFSYSRLADILEENLSMSATELNRSILDQVERFSGRTDYDDDLTMITIKCADAAAATEIAPVSDESKA
ncbi:MAG: SpoIIE family protein phosphatase [Opitutales bacterium]|nr:SpoIIE family protein phosphatase [Opitutales bacterium]